MGVFAMEQIIITNVKDAKCDLDYNQNEQFDPGGEHKYAYEFQRSDISKPFAQGWGKLEVFFYTLQPGKAACPYHYHTANEEFFYIISGRGTLKTPEGSKAVSEGDAIVMPAHENGAHTLINTSEAPLVYIDLQTVISPEVVIHPESQKAVLFAPNVFMKAFKIDSAVNYLTGE